MASTSGRERQSHLAAVAGVGGGRFVTWRFMHRRRRGVSVPLAALIACALLVGPAVAATSSAASAEQPKLVFWMGTNDNGIFDNQTLDFIADNANIAVLNAPLTAVGGAPSYAQVVAGLHARDPQLPVLMYFWATRIYAGATYGGVLRSGSMVTKALVERNSLILKNPMNGSALRNHTVSYGDVTSPGYVTWLIGQTKNMMNATGVNGLASDVADREPFPEWCQRKPAFCKQYATGVDSLFAKLKSAINPKTIIFNGLWANKPGRLASQEQLLNDTDGAAIEWFGRVQSKPVQPFAVGLLPYMNAIAKHPGKRFLVFARGATGYTGYRDDWLWQRYLYAAYLMVAGPNTSFRYLSTFQWPSPGRANMFTLYKDVANRIGAPDGPYHKTGDLYYRNFTNGLALMVPSGGQQHEYTLTRTLYDADGSAVNGKVEVEPGNGVILFNNRPPNTAWTLSFSSGEGTKLGLPGARIVKPANGASFLQLSKLSPEQTWQHDILLDPVKPLSPTSTLRIRLRTTDPTAQLVIAAEVDDTDAKTVQGITVLDAGTCQRRTGSFRIAFRTSQPRTSYPSGCVSNYLHPDGQWHTYVIPTTKVLPARLSVRRWEYMRISGAMDVASISESPAG